MTNSGRPPGPPAPPLIPGHLGTPGEHVCMAALAVLAVASATGDEAVVRRAENRVRSAGLRPQALESWMRQRVEREGFGWVEEWIEEPRLTSGLSDGHLDRTYRHDHKFGKAGEAG